jgi:hypothetical protein
LEGANLSETPTIGCEIIMSEPLLRVHNHHAAGCGDPPIVDGDDPNIYIGYYENPFGEQWIFTYHRKTRKSDLRGGDVGWNTVHAVVDGKVAGLILGKEEAIWLQACWRAATGGA